MEFKQFLRSRKFFFTCLSVVIFLLGIWVFKMDCMNLATSITILTAPYLVSNVISKFAKPKNNEIG